MIYEILNKGKQNATSKAELMRLTGIPTERKLCRLIEKERKAGRLILSKTGGKGGYYMPCCRREIEEFVKTEKKRAANIYRSIRAAREQLKTMPGQLEMAIKVSDHDGGVEGGSE